MSYQITFHPGALHELKKLPQSQQKKIGEVIGDLAEKPRPLGSVKLTGVEAYRVRIGEYRVAYAVKDKRVVVLILKIGHRRDIYRELETIKQRRKKE